MKWLHEAYLEERKADEAIRSAISTTIYNIEQQLQALTDMVEDPDWLELTPNERRAKLGKELGIYVSTGEKYPLDDMMDLGVRVERSDAAIWIVDDNGRGGARYSISSEIIKIYDRYGVVAAMDLLITNMRKAEEHDAIWIVLSRMRDYLPTLRHEIVHAIDDTDHDMMKMSGGYPIESEFESREEFMVAYVNHPVEVNAEFIRSAMKAQRMDSDWGADAESFVDDVIQSLKDSNRWQRFTEETRKTIRKRAYTYWSEQRSKSKTLARVMGWDLN